MEGIPFDRAIDLDKVAALHAAEQQADEVDPDAPPVEIDFPDMVALTFAIVHFLTEAFGPAGGVRITQLFEQQRAEIAAANEEDDE